MSGHRGRRFAQRVWAVVAGRAPVPSVGAFPPPGRFVLKGVI